MGPTVRFLAPAAFAFLATLLPAACARSVTDFEFLTPAGKAELRMAGDPSFEGDASEGGQGGFLDSHRRGKGGPSPFVRETARFQLERPYRPSAGEHFYLTYRSGGAPLSLHLFEEAGGRRRERELELPAGEATVAARDVTTAGRPNGRQPAVRFLVPLDGGMLLDGFQVTGGAAAEIAILAAGVGGGFPGVLYTPTETVIRAGVVVRFAPPGNSRGIDFAPLVGALGEHEVQIAVGYAQRGPAGRVEITPSGQGRSATLRLAAHPGEHRVYLYSASCGFTPERITISAESPGFELRSLEVRAAGDSPADRRFRSAGLSALEPIPADFGTIIAYEASRWRQTDYELFSWSLAPSVLVLQFRDLEVQSRYLKRIAFFAEKEGYAGRLWTNEELEGLHGWNAHDYRGEELARFYSEADRQGFALNGEEVSLRTLLLARELILRAPGGYRAGRGAIIAFSDAGNYALRRLLLTHEGYHGIFFTNPAFRERVSAAWAKADPEERELFRLFLRSKGYEAGNDYLTVNEFAAYLLQQPAEEAVGYFRWQLAGVSDGRRSAEQVAALLRHRPQLFKASALEIAEALRAAAEVDAEAVVELEPVVHAGVVN